jgi:hypothetical protein
VLITGGRTIYGALHLQPLALFHSGPETPEDALNRNEAFFPLTSDKQTVFLAKSQVIAVTVRSMLPVRDLERLEAARTLGMQVELSDAPPGSGPCPRLLESRHRVLLPHRSGRDAVRQSLSRPSRHSPGLS